MPHPLLSQSTVLDLVPFGNAGAQTGFYALRLTPPDWDDCLPGQFVMIRPAAAGSEMLWGRPFSICRKTARDLVLFFQVRGRATAAMEQLKPGDELNIWGPLGNGLAMEAKTPTLLLAGGIGIAPFVGYAHAHPTPGDVTMEFGHRMPLDCYPFESINQKITATAHLEKNSNDRATFLAVTEERIANLAPSKPGDKGGLVLACGPTPFLRAVQTLSLRYNTRAQLCLETRMACGIGACLGCVVKATLPPESAHTASPAFVPNAPGAAASGGCTEGCCPEPGYVQTCMCGPNFWADSFTFSDT